MPTRFRQQTAWKGCAPQEKFYWGRPARRMLGCVPSRLADVDRLANQTLDQSERMEHALQITFRNMPPSPAIEDAIREKTEKLESHYGRILGCHVVVEAPHRHHHKGKAYLVRIDLKVPGGELVINRGRKRLNAAKLRDPELAGKDLAESHEPSKHAAHEDVYVAIRDAFNSAGRKLLDYARKRRGAVKIHEPAAMARVAKIFAEESYGFLETSDGRQIYFHRNSVLQPGFDHLEPGAEVHFVEGVGDKGPQATTVRLTGRS